MLAGDQPLFLQIAQKVEESIVDGSLPEGARAPSSNELSAFYRINPATAAKGLGRLVDRGVLHKRRGLGMFVSPGAREQLRQERRTALAEHFVDPLLAEARRLDLDGEDVALLVRERAAGAEPPTRRLPEESP
ncbi:GntR family transcriptional regulator [Brachybacterium sp. YJGR34]|uniref:GntR family transcriptional regulator n=1 Tax=Brachybacterium sp. YJGR34 TaxID=2059911 RepID=UPI000E0C9DF7|nr:GntR family transcriptional regulator [Brachybacterium sp. YJGR34]